MNRRVVLALLALLVFGAIKLPLEQRLETERRAAYFGGAQITLNLRQQLGQESFLAVMGGFRALVADFCYLEAHAQWTRVEWGRMKLNFDAATALQPRCILFWEQAAWHMAFNASVAAFEDPKQPKQALRIKAQREYWKIGEDYLLRGLGNNPNSSALYGALAFLYQQKFQDHCKSSAAYARCAELGALPYARRISAYELAQCPGHEREAYDKLLAMYREGEKEHLPSLLKWLGILQEKLDIPPEQRVNIPPSAHP